MGEAHASELNGVSPEERMALLRALRYWDEHWDWECSTLFGFEHDELQRLLRDWPAVCDADRPLAVAALLGALRELLGGASPPKDKLPTIIGLDQTQTERLYRQLRRILTRPAFGKGLHPWCADGSLRDIYVHDVTPDDWGGFLALVESYSREYRYGDDVQVIEDVSSVFTRRDEAHLLTINVGEGVSVNCHFFVPEQIELDLDPRQMTNPGSHECMMTFIERLAEAVSKKVYLTPEGCERSPLAKYDPEIGEWHVYALALHQ